MAKNNYSVKVRMLQLNGAVLRNLKGKTATKRCLIIPVDDNPCIFVGEKDVYLNLNAFEVSNPQYGDTHCLKPSLPKELREAMTQEERDAVVIVGNMRPLPQEERPQMQPSGTMDASAFSSDNGEDDLPF